ncbi:ImmA/IrrE family metallo-endopeptidase [Anaerovorax sp. IOR16]|uniref:ImmA/IrrE family metallo-endopeptidase n=1 Tax=Anaerovorax sp. IOR16 TaxID=2773458 RepID=UPI0019D020C0|nr:ImmA/IrrE family metallo-endopeptidase [Anaerovorax sp. IOR16]
MELQKVKSLVKAYKTADPFELCDYLNINVTYHDLGNIRGYYTKQRRSKFIVLNLSLEDYLKKIVCAHELGHAVMHPGLNTPFNLSNTFFSKDKYEVQANKFSAYLILEQFDKNEFNNESLCHISCVTGIPIYYLGILHLN